MTFEDLKVSYIISCLVLGLIILSPTLAMVIRFPSVESFSELWILGPNRMAENYPFNVSENEVYSIYLGVGNHIGSSAYYVVYVKLTKNACILDKHTLSQIQIAAILPA